MMRYRLRTLLIVLALGPVVLACDYWQATEWLAQALMRGRAKVPEPRKE